MLYIHHWNANPNRSKPMTTKTITILAGRADEARARVKKLDKKAKKYGVEFAA